MCCVSLNLAQMTRLSVIFFNPCTGDLNSLQLINQYVNPSSSHSITSIKYNPVINKSIRLVTLLVAIMHTHKETLNQLDCFYFVKKIKINRGIFFFEFKGKVPV